VAVREGDKTIAARVARAGVHADHRGLHGRNGAVSGALGLAVTAALLAAGAAQAQDLKPAPAYYLDAVVAFTAAEALARSCSTVSVDPVQATAESGRLLDQLRADGFDTTRADAGMEDPTEALNARLTGLMEKHGLAAGATEAQVCAAARAEMAEGGMLAGFLVEVPG
jgi:hypothetical protein